MNIIVDILGLTMMVCSITVALNLEIGVGDKNNPTLTDAIGGAILYFMAMIPIVAFGYLGWFIFNK